MAMGPSYPESVSSLQAQTFTSCKTSLFVYIGLLGGHDLLLHLLCFICLITDRGLSTFQNILDFTCYSCRLRSHGLLRWLGL